MDDAEPFPLLKMAVVGRSRSLHHLETLVHLGWLHGLRMEGVHEGIIQVALTLPTGQNWRLQAKMRAISLAMQMKAGRWP